MFKAILLKLTDEQNNLKGGMTGRKLEAIIYFTGLMSCKTPTYMKVSIKDFFKKSTVFLKYFQKSAIKIGFFVTVPCVFPGVPCFQ